MLGKIKMFRTPDPLKQFVNSRYTVLEKPKVVLTLNSAKEGKYRSGLEEVLKDMHHYIVFNKENLDEATIEYIRDYVREIESFGYRSEYIDKIKELLSYYQ